ncbi:hypothetical protein Hanom_Chr06g00493011 [Helianthus anomalus]
MSGTSDLMRRRESGSVFLPSPSRWVSDFLFSDFIMDFLRSTGLSFSQTMPMIWRVLVILDRIKNTHIPELCVNDLPVVYRLRSHGSSRFLLYSTSNNPLGLRASRIEEDLKTKLFFCEKKFDPWWREFSNSNKMPVFLDLDELDSYSIPVQVKKETPATTSSKPTTAPKSTPQPRACASSSKKRKGSKTATAAPGGFSYEDLSFTDSLEPMISFLHKIIISDQGKIADTKTQYYEDKLKKVTQDAEVKLAAGQVDHEQTMISFRDGVKNSAVVSLLQARIKMAYEAKEAGLECPPRQRLILGWRLELMLERMLMLELMLERMLIRMEPRRLLRVLLECSEVGDDGY